MCYRTLSLSLSASPRIAAPERVEPLFPEQVPLMVPLLVPLSVKAKLRSRLNFYHSERSESDAAKTVPWPGATPLLASFCGPKPLRAVGVAPGHGSPSTESSLGFLPRHNLTKLWYRTLTNSWYGSRSRDLREA